MFYVDVTYRQRDPRGVDLPFDKCECVRSGPFLTAEAAEKFATSLAGQTPVFSASIEPVDAAKAA
jgi:hypothetical protein